jgi:hypothetical protein
MSNSQVSSRHCEEPTGPARSGRPDNRLRDEAIQDLNFRTGLLRFVALAMTRERKNKGGETPADAMFDCPHASGVRYAPRKERLAPPSACGRARLPAFHRGSCQGDFRPQGSASGQASWDASGALDPVRPPQPGGGDLTRLNGCYPPRPVPVQRSTSRAGRIAGRMMPETARERR